MPRAKKADPPARKADTPTLVRTSSPRKKRVAIPPDVARDTIAQRAYELFMEDGGQHGRDLEHWLRAEAEVLQGSALSKAS
jgi:Protein of unknown function (DUF2934)